jgi:hypothetical protein
MRAALAAWWRRVVVMTDPHDATTSLDEANGMTPR